MLSGAICFTNPTSHLDDHHHHTNYGDLHSEWPKPTSQTLHSDIFKADIKTRFKAFSAPNKIPVQTLCPQITSFFLLVALHLVPFIQPSSALASASGVQLQHFESATGPGFDAQELTEGPGTPPTPRWTKGD